MSTIQQVARAAGVSIATVSRTLSRPQVVGEATQRKVLKAVKALNYLPNAAAKSLRTLRTGKLLVTVPDIANPFFSLIIQGIEDAAQQEGYAVLLGDTRHDPEREERYALMLQRQEADGLIFLGHRMPKTLTAWTRQRSSTAPIVNGCEFSPRLGVPSAHIDNAAAAGDAMEHLYGLGHRRIGIITGPLASPLSRDRLHGVMARAAAREAKRELTVVQGDFSIESGIAGAAHLLKKKLPPTAVFCFSDEMAVGVMDHARTQGREVPRDLSVVGFDDIRFAPYLTPPLTTIRQPMAEIGRETVRLLLEILRSQARPKSVTLPHTLLIRESTAALRR
jgi:LacI family repressor for deo operon, udp, cdd, tsx, nupC, and nupG